MKPLHTTMQPLPSDRAVLEHIVARYQREFDSGESAGKKRMVKKLIAIDVDDIGQSFGVDGDLVFSILYHHLNRKYGWVDTDGVKNQIIYPQVAQEGEADLRDYVDYAYSRVILERSITEDKRHFWTVGSAIASAFFALGSAVAAFLALSSP